MSTFNMHVGNLPKSTDVGSEVLKGDVTLYRVLLYRFFYCKSLTCTGDGVPLDYGVDFYCRCSVVYCHAMLRYGKIFGG